MGKFICKFLSHMTQKHIHDGIRKSERKTQREYELLQFFLSLFFRVIYIFPIIPVVVPFFFV